MWLFTRYGFFSVSLFEKKNSIRARSKEHLELLMERFPALNQKVLVLVGTDYRYRILVVRKVWEATIAELAKEQGWTNFKNEAAHCHGMDSDYVRALHEVWHTMYTLQTAEVANLSKKK